jgi:hypothetical protein
MPPCKNDPKSSYTGKEPSPKGKGWCAHAMKLGAKKRGADGAQWSVAARANGSRYWKKASAAKKPALKKTAAAKKPRGKKALLRASSMYPVKVPRPDWNFWLKQLASPNLTKLIKEVLPALRKQGIQAEAVPLPYDKERGVYWIDLAWDWVRDVKKWTPDKPLVLVVVRYDGDTKRLAPGNTVQIQHSGIVRKTKTDLIEIMRAAFSKAFTWTGTSAKTMSLRIQ